MNTNSQTPNATNAKKNVNAVPSQQDQVGQVTSQFARLGLDQAQAQSQPSYEPQTQEGGKKKKNVAKKATPKKAAPKKGGSIIKDVQNLAVPFGIILAKKGLDKFMKSSKKSVAAEEKSKVSAGQKAAEGGAKKAKKPATKEAKKTPKKGGAIQLQQEFNKLSQEIESFLSKY